MANRTVFDTNIWISYFLGGKFDELIKLRRENSVLFLHSTPSVAELKDVISRDKFKKNNLDVDKLIDFYIGISDFCKTKPEFIDCPDPKDNFLFDLAIQGNAKYLVSGDKRVLETPMESKTLKIATLAAFKEDLQSRK
ncbi:MAG: putative toxin-antitoxin system toxin component, PIN family [Dysgonamonadaceae bacterium]|jgi:putative PIN family toxin of toxin-antitoxin system|nr:putative toxin-antitoxin system toxin component, PIN family [Dysgonamonadaceae bacterium]